MNDEVPFPKETSFLREKKKELTKVTEEIKPITIKHHLVHSGKGLIKTVGSWFKGSFTVDVSEPKPNMPNTMNLVEKRAQELGLYEDFVNGRARSLGSRIIKGVEEG